LTDSSYPIDYYDERSTRVLFIFLTIYVNDYSASLTAVSLSSPVSPSIEKISSIYWVISLTFAVAGVSRDELPSYENAIPS